MKRENTHSLESVAKKQRREEVAPPPSTVTIENGTEYLAEPMDAPMYVPTKISLSKDAAIFPHRRIGFGSFSLVQKGEINGTSVAIKMLKLKNPLKQTDLVTPLDLELEDKAWDFLDAIPGYSPRKQVANEIQILNALKKHPNIAQIVQTFSLGTDPLSRGKIVFICMEYAQGLIVTEYLSFNGPISAQSGKVLFANLCNGIKYCHDNFITHGDIKCDNLLVDPNNNYSIKLIDFGFGQILKPSEKEIETQLNGTMGYYAPEKLVKYTIDPYAADIWSTGAVLHFILTLKFPFDHAAHKKKKPAMQIDTLFPKQWTPFLEQILDLTPEKRPKITEMQQIVGAW